jgi:hypothetical protein
MDIPWHCLEWKRQNRPFDEVAAAAQRFSSEMLNAVHWEAIADSFTVQKLVGRKK